MEAGGFVDDVADELDKVNEAGEEELDWMDGVGVVHCWWIGLVDVTEALKWLLRCP